MRLRIATFNFLNTFNAILMLTSYHSLRWMRMIWEKEDVGVPIVYQVLKKSEFEAIKKYLRFLMISPGSQR